MKALCGVQDPGIGYCSVARKGDISRGVCPLLLTLFCGCLSHHPAELLTALLVFPSLPCSERGFQRQAWWSMSVILALGRWREEEEEFKACLIHVRPCLKIQAESFFPQKMGLELKCTRPQCQPLATVLP